MNAIISIGVNLFNCCCIIVEIHVLQYFVMSVKFKSFFKIIVFIFSCCSLLSLSPCSLRYCDIKNIPFADDDRRMILKLNAIVEKRDRRALRLFERENLDTFLSSCYVVLNDILFQNKVAVARFLLLYLILEDCDIPESLWVDVAWKALELESLDLLDCVVEGCPGLKVPGSSLLHIAVLVSKRWERDRRLINTIYRHHKAIDERDKDGMTPLHRAVSKGHIFFVKFLCDEGADIFVKDKNGITPVDMARRDGRLHILYEMLTHQPFPLSRQDVLMLFRLSVEKYYFDILLKLLKNYPSYINEQDSEGETLLHHAIHNNRVYVAKELVKHGARFDIENHNGETPLHFAIRKGNMGEVLILCELSVCSLGDILKDFSYIQCALEAKDTHLFLKLYRFLDCRQDDHVFKLMSIAIENGHPFILGMLFPSYISKSERERLLKVSLKDCSFEKFKKEFDWVCLSGYINCQILIDIYRIRPEIIHWINFASHNWLTDDKMKFLESVVKEGCDQPLTLFSYAIEDRDGWSACVSFLDALLDSQIDVKSLKCSVEGTALISLLQARCVKFNVSEDYDALIFKLIDRDMGVNEETPLGKPLNHYLYKLSNHMKNLDKDNKIRCLTIVHALLEKYEKDDVSVGRLLNPGRVEEFQEEEKEVFVGEYMQTPLGATLVCSHPSQELYNEVKFMVDLEELNDHGRNFVHHLALLKVCFEDNLKVFFQKCGYESKDIERFVNLQDDDGMTPLMYATRNPRFFQELIDCGADISLTDKRGFSVAQHLMIHGEDEVIKIFLRHQNTPFSSQDDDVRLKKKIGYWDV